MISLANAVLLLHATARLNQVWTTTSPMEDVVVTTNAPVLRWNSSVDSGGTFAYQVDIASVTSDGITHTTTPLWSSGQVWLGNWPASSPAFPGLCVYDGEALAPSKTYSFTVQEWQAADHTGAKVNTTWSAGKGSFVTAAALPSAEAELISELRATNMTKLWNTSSTSVWSRVEPSGFLPTSVSGGYGGITSEFVRDGAGMIIAILELGPDRWEVARKAMRFMLHGLQCTQNTVLEPGCSVALKMTRPPEVLRGDCPESARKAGRCHYNTKIVGVDANEETDGAFYVIEAWGRVVAVTNDTALERDFYPTLKTYMNYYFRDGAVSSRGVPYWNQSLGLLWTPHLEHSRLTKMWSAYDSLTNSFAVEAIRCMLEALRRQEPDNTKLAALWTQRRQALIDVGLGRTLAYAGEATAGQTIYAEMLGHVTGYGPLVRDPTPLLWGMSWVQTAVINLLVPHLSSAGGDRPVVPVSELGVNLTRLGHTFEAYSRSGSFVWMNEDESLSALVPTTNVNSSRLRHPPYRTGPPPPLPPLQSCSQPLRGRAALSLAKGRDSWAGPTRNFSDCCAKCTDAGPSGCHSWFYNGDQGRCILKLAATNDTVTKPSPNFYAGRTRNGPNPNGWCTTISWPFGGTCHPGCPCPARVTIGKGIGWEVGWMAYTNRWTRLIALTRWLGAAHHVDAEPLFGENLDYDCIKGLEAGTHVSPSNGRCWGDPGNGVQIGWWVWAQALLRRKLGIL